jgi:hypothetical protein
MCPFQDMTGALDWRIKIKNRRNSIQETMIEAASVGNIQFPSMRIL